ncbi:MAG: hypothetical protein A2X08_02005 [Bacteroidetes bacterium GWA2_32_17]|nr:MAG: hypothetical protein A2X08_02005 [Bacteroidetes bacterium GWA2_32_17]
MNKKAVILFNPLSSPKGNNLDYPWNLIYLERMIRHLDIEIILIEERFDKDYNNIVQNTKGRLLFAGVSAIAGYQIVSGIKFSETVKSITGAPVIWGGWFPTVFPEMILNDNYTDYICVGQGEVPFKTFTERMISNEDISDIPGIGYRKNGNIFINPNKGLIKTDTFPRIDMTLIDPNRIIDLNGKEKLGSRGIDYLASIGCTNHCTFCNLATAYEGNWFPKRIPEIIEELRYLIEKAGISYVIFCDNNFFAGKRFVLELCNAIIQAGFSFTWDAQAHVDYFLRNFSDEDIRVIYKAGCRRLKFGAESGDQEVIDLVNKKLKVEDNLKIVKVCKKHNIRIRLHTMLCFPLNPEKDFWLTLNMIGKAILIDHKAEIDIAFYKPFPKSPLFDMSTEKGFISPITTNELIAYIYNKTDAPWYNKDFYKELRNFVFFYFLYANPYYFKTFPLKLRPFAFLLNILMYPIIYFRFKLNLIKFPIEAKLFRKILQSKKEQPFFFSISINKTRYLREHA